MSKAGKLVKDMLKAKKESVMGKLGDSPYEDPMEPWSAKYAQPVKEETLNEDGLLMKYIRSLGFNPEFMSFAQRSSYARSNAFKRYKEGHTFDREKQNLKQEEQENVSEAGFVDVSRMSDREIQRMGHADDDEPVRRSYNKPADHPHAVHINGKKWKTFGSQSHATNVAKKIKGATVHREEVNEETEQLDEAGTGLLMSFIKSKGLNPLAMDGNQKKAYARSSEFRIFKMRHMKEASGMGERGDDWNEASSPAQQAAIAINMQKKGIKPKKVQEEADAKDTVCFDIPLLIRVLEFTREDMKTDIELHNMVERLIDMRHEVPLTMDNYDAITGKLKESKDAGEYDYEGAMAKTQLQTICRNADDLKNMLKDDENLPEWVQAKITKAEDYITTSLDYLKSTQELDEEAYGPAATAALRNKEPSHHVAAMDRKDKENKLNVDRDRALALQKVSRDEDPTLTHAGNAALKAQQRQRMNNEENVSEMDKSQTPPGRDGSGSDSDAGKKQYYGKTITPKQTTSKASEILKKAFKNAHKKKNVSEEQIDELSSDLLGRYKKAAGAQASAADKAGDYDKGNKRFSGIMKATKKQFDNDAKKINELKKQDDNMELDDRITREEKKMKGADPCWKGYQMVGTKKKGGRTVPNCVPEEVVQEGIGGIEDSPMSATNSVKAMESEQRKKNMKSARIIKSIYKKKGKNESTYDWEKDDKPNAKITLQGGTTMTGKPRDTVEIEPVLKTRPNSQKQ